MKLEPNYLLANRSAPFPLQCSLTPNAIFRVYFLLVLAAGVCVANAETFKVPFSDRYKGRRAIIVDVLLNGQGPYPFILDTCSNVCAVDSGLFKELKLKRLGRDRASAGGSASISISQSKISKVRIGDAPLDDLEVSSFKFPNGIPYRGILGADLLKRYVVQVDFTRRTLGLTPASDVKHAWTGLALPLRIDQESELPCVEVSVEGHPGWFLFDTGNATDLVLHSGFVEKYRFKQARKSLMAPGQTVVGVHQSLFTRVDRASIGPFTIDRPLAYMAISKGDNLQSVDGNVGMTTIRMFDFTIDYPHKTLVLSKNASFNTPEAGSSMGMTISFRKQGLLISGVDTKGICGIAGLRKGDYITTIDGLPVQGLDSFTLEGMFEGKPGDIIPVTILRNGAEHNLKIELVNQF